MVAAMSLVQAETAGDPAAVDPIGIAAGDVDDLGKQAGLERDRLEPERQELVVVDDQVVLRRLLARVGQIGDRGRRSSSATSSARSRTRCVSVIWLKILTRSPRLRRVRERELDAAHRVLDVDEGAGLAAGAVNGQRIADRRLDQEAVQHRAVVAVIVEAVDQLDVTPGLLGMGAPDDALVQVGDPAAPSFLA